MNVITIPPEQADRWENYLRECPRTVAWQSYHWNDAVRRLYPVDFLPLAAVDGDAIVGILPLYQLHRKGQPSRLYSVAYAVAGGLTADSLAAQNALLEAAIDRAKQLNAPGLTFKQYRYPIESTLKTDANFFNRELSLDVGEARLWAELLPRNRTVIESTANWNLRLEYPSTRVDAFHEFLLRFSKRQGIPGPDRRWIQTLLDLKMYNIALLERNGRIVAATMVKAFKTTVSFPYTCMLDASDDSLTATYTLYWQLIQRFTRDGYKIFHSGRIPQSEEVEPYRLGWGGQKHTYHYQYYPETGGQTEFSAKRGWKRRLFVTGWKFMPMPLAKMIGPRIIAKFP